MTFKGSQRESLGNLMKSKGNLRNLKDIHGKFEGNLHEI